MASRLVVVLALAGCTQTRSKIFVEGTRPGHGTTSATCTRSCSTRSSAAERASCTSACPVVAVPPERSWTEVVDGDCASQVPKPGDRIVNCVDMSDELLLTGIGIGLGIVVLLVLSVAASAPVH